jgi:hypothetical protein
MARLTSQRPLFRLRRKTQLPVTISSTEPAKPFCSCFTKQPAWLKKTADTHWTWHRSFRISFARPKIGSRNWKLRLGFIRTKPTARSSGCTRSIRRSRIDFCGRTPLPEVCQAPRNDVGRKSLRSVHLKRGTSGAKLAQALGVRASAGQELTASGAALCSNIRGIDGPLVHSPHFLTCCSKNRTVVS